jgi:hypothetical protein
MSNLEFLFAKVIINGVEATWVDKLEFLKRKPKSRAYLYNGLIDIETE